ncbi:outer membrane beta-barrel protein [Pseudorhodoferax sp.]|uniref:outer membrane beta-barrel protein n=1 Tax=Pseudorhodoferax sp. TaxID=1993553 RepID=UPI002DD67A69|nr:outer membrane beta-barrel protein [Pseudorhodoferax sp.]
MRKILSPLAAVGFVALFGLSAGAQAADTYVGGAISTPNYSNQINGMGGDGGGHDAGVKLYGGYKFTPNFAVEGGYVNLARSKDIDGTVKGQGVYVDGVGSVAVAPQLSVYGSAGVADVRFRTPDGDDSSPALKLGLGVQYDLNQTVALRVGYDRYHFTDAFDGKANVGQATAGVQVAF